MIDSHLLKRNEIGATAVLVGIVITVLLAFAALAVDLSHIFVVKNELQNAADAGALAGAEVLYVNDGVEVNEGANQVAYDAATLNKSEQVPVDIHWSGNEGDVERGHWSFASRTFTPNSSLESYDLWDVDEETLDSDKDFINAVRVKTRREDTPALSFLAQLFGYDDFTLGADAVAYLGFAGTLLPEEVAQPIVICKEALLKDGKYTCSIGRMINSGQNEDTNETGGWTDLNQDGQVCQGGTNSAAVRSLICGGGNSDPIILGRNMATNGGQISSAFSDLRNCWLGASDSDNDKKPDQQWNMTLPVVECPGNNITTCQKVVGAVNVNVIWVTDSGADSCLFKMNKNLPPLKMGDWACKIQNPQNQADFNTCWNSFVTHFNLQNVNGSPAPCAKQSIYFRPDCEYHEPTGRSGGENFGILADIPVLVE